MGKNLVDGGVVELDSEYQLVVNPSSIPAIHIPGMQYQVHNKKELSPEEWHDHLEITLLILREKVKLRIKDE